MSISRVVGVLAVLLVLVSGCGKSRPSRAEVEKAFRTGIAVAGARTPFKLDASLASCAADVLAKAKVSDGDLADLVDASTGSTKLSSRAALQRVEKPCGGGARPGELEMSQAFQKGVAGGRSGAQVKLTAKQADCAAKIFWSSAISREALRAIISGDKTFKESKADDVALRKVIPAMQKCAG